MRVKSLRDEIEETHLMNPLWTYKEVAEFCSVSSDYVRSVARLRGLDFKSKRIITPKKEKKETQRRKSSARSRKDRLIFYGKSPGFSSFSSFYEL